MVLRHHVRIQTSAKRRIVWGRKSGDGPECSGADRLGSKFRDLA